MLRLSGVEVTNLENNTIIIKKPNNYRYLEACDKSLIEVLNEKTER